MPAVQHEYLTALVAPPSHLLTTRVLAQVADGRPG